LHAPSSQHFHPAKLQPAKLPIKIESVLVIVKHRYDKHGLEMLGTSKACVRHKDG
jgi:hypothetical protein